MMHKKSVVSGLAERLMSTSSILEQAEHKIDNYLHLQSHYVIG